MSWWWLRTLGFFDDYSALVDTDGKIDCFGSKEVNTYCCIRPVMWIKPKFFYHLVNEIKLRENLNVNLGRIKIGSFINFGNYPQNAKIKKALIEWEILAVENGKVLLISHYGLDAQVYINKEGIVSWEESYLRKWLNDEFLKIAFNENEQNIIRLSKLKSNKSSEYDINDNIFLLNEQEAELYYSSNDDRKCKPTKFATKAGVYVDNKGRCRWWLKSQDFTHYALFVDRDGKIYLNYSSSSKVSHKSQFEAVLL